MKTKLLIMFIGIPFADKRIFGLDLLKILPSILVSTAVMFSAIFLFKQVVDIIWLRLVLSVVVGVVVYFVCSLLMKNRLIKRYYCSFVSKVSSIGKKKDNVGE